MESKATLLAVAFGLTLTTYAFGGKEIEPAEPGSYYPFSISAEVGTTGYGGQIGWRFSDHFGVRGGVHGLSYSDSREISGVDYSGRLRLLSEPLTFDFFPSGRSSFHISVGILLNQNEFSGTAKASDNRTFKINGERFDARDVGKLHVDVEHPDVGFYLGIGGNFFYFDDARQWSMGGELGIVFTGSPDVSYRRSGGTDNRALDREIERAIRNEKRDIEDDVEEFKYWPVLRLNVKYQF